MNSSPSQPKPPFLERVGLYLRPIEQRAMAAILITSLLTIGLYFVFLRMRGDDLLDIDAAPRRTAKYVVDINTAEWPELANIPGLGRSLAESIIEYRAEHGDFESLEEIDNVHGIGPSKLKNLKQYLIPIASDLEMSSR